MAMLVFVDIFVGLSVFGNWYTAHAGPVIASKSSDIIYKELLKYINGISSSTK
jgi:hypothetical protein